VDREHLETKNYECQESKFFYGQPIFDEYTSDGDEHNFSMIYLEPLSIIPVYDDYESDPWECYGGVEGQLHMQLISYPSPKNEQPYFDKTHVYEE